MAEYKTITYESNILFLERKSKFIGQACPVGTAAEAEAYIAKKKKEHYNATHNVYAYIVRENNVSRCSDDGEPQGTAGMPILGVLQNEHVTDLVVVATRYFGGILLGAGGLIRAYAHTAKLALDDAGIVTMQKGFLGRMVCDYALYERVLSCIQAHGGIVEDTQFLAEVTISFLVTAGKFAIIGAAVRELSCGQAELTNTGERYFALPAVKKL